MKYYFCVFIEKKIRVDIYLSALFNNFSRSYIQKIIDRWQLTINWFIIKKNIKIKNKDELKIVIINQKLDWILPEKIDFDVVYEDKDILVINKDAWINVHPVPWEGWNKKSLVNWILEHCKNKLPSIWWVERPWIVHRLDKDTSWLIMVAKTDYMMNYLSKIIKNREIGKYYLAIVYWKIKDNDFKIESFIWRDPNNRLKMTTIKPINPKIAITYWKVLKYIDNKYTLVKIKLETWRTHQIRVHLSSIWFPILWDKLYWNESINKKIFKEFNLNRQALHAYKLYLKLYWKDYNFEAKLKDDMKKIIWNEIIL